MTLTAKDVAEISRLLEESDFDELTLELDGLKLMLRRNGGAAPASASQAGAPATTPAGGSAPARASTLGAAVPAPAPPSAPASASVPDVASDSDATQSVTAPLLGTFYRAPKPGAPPFVEIGAAVEEDTIIGIIEVMKLMNTVRAGTRGTVAEILAQDGALVEYGETLMRVSKAARA